MQSNTETIKNLFRRYRYYKMQVENGLGGDLLKEQLSFLEKSIDALNPNDQKLIKDVFIDDISIVNVAKISYCHRNTVYNRIEKIIGLMAEVYTGQFKT